MSSMQDFDDDVYGDLVSGGNEVEEEEEEQPLEEEPVEEDKGDDDAPSD